MYTCNCVGKQGLAVKWWRRPTYECQPNQIPCFVDTVIIHVAVLLQVCCNCSIWSELSHQLPREYPRRTCRQPLKAIQFSYNHVLVQHLCIIIVHNKHNTNIQQLTLSCIIVLYTSIKKN